MTQIDPVGSLGQEPLSSGLARPGPGFSPENMGFTDYWRRLLVRWRGPDPGQDLGRYGEHVAERHYRGLGCDILARNWRHGQDELDLVVLDGVVLVFVEVKARTTDEGGEGYYAVNRRKKRALRRAARGWLREIGGAEHLRFDVVEVLVCHKGAVRILHHGGETLFGRRRP